MSYSKSFYQMIRFTYTNKENNMNELLQQYSTEITMVMAILIPIMPTLIMKVLSDRRLQTTFTNLKEAATIRLDSALELAQKVEHLTQLITNQEKLTNLMEYVISITDSSTNALVEVKESSMKALDEMKLATEQLKLKDETIAWITQELKDLKSKLGVR